MNRLLINYGLHVKRLAVACGSFSNLDDADSVEALERILQAATESGRRRQRLPCEAVAHWHQIIAREELDDRHEQELNDYLDDLAMRLEFFTDEDPAAIVQLIAGGLLACYQLGMAQHQTRALGWIFVAYISAFVGVAAPLIHRSDAEDIERAVARPIRMSILIARRFPESYLLDGRVLERVEDYGNSATYRELDVPDGSEMVVGWQTLRQAVQQWSTQ